MAITREERIKNLQQKYQNRFLPKSISPTGPTFGNLAYEQEQVLQKQKLDQQLNESKARKAAGVPGLPENVKTAIEQTGDLDAASKIIALQKSAADSPQSQARVFAKMLLPAMKEFDVAHPGVSPIMSYMRGLGVETTAPLGFFPEYTSYQKTLQGMKPIIAKGVLGQTGQLTEQEQQDPLGLFPSIYDTEEQRKKSIDRILGLLEAVSGENYREAFKTGQFSTPGQPQLNQADLMKQLDEINRQLSGQ